MRLRTKAAKRANLMKSKKEVQQEREKSIRKREELKKDISVVKAAIESGIWSEVYKNSPRQFPPTLAGWRKMLGEMEKELADLDAEIPT